MKIQQPKKPETRTEVDFLFERANVLSKKPVRKIDSKIKKKPTVETNLDLDYKKLVTFWDKGGIIDPHITYPPLVHFSGPSLSTKFITNSHQNLPVKPTFRDKA